MKLCQFPDCGRKHHANGYCIGHCHQIMRGCELSELRSVRPKNTLPVINYKEIPCLNSNLEGPCHVWQHYLNDSGYGLFFYKNKRIRVHRYIWELVNGPIPDNLEIDHICQNRACCNIDHLRIVTHRINCIENSNSPSAINASKTHCKNGHVFDEQNTYISKNGKRRCKICHKNWVNNRKQAFKDSHISTSV